MGGKLTARQKVFADEYLVDLNGKAAAIRAGYAPSRAHVTASELLAKPTIQAYIQERQRERQTRVELRQDDVLRMLRDVAETDPNELVQLRRGCCRYCYGAGHGYQRSPAERARELRAWELERAASKDPDRHPPFAELGGIGWNPKRPPVPDCPECFGDGAAEVFLQDTRSLSPAARSLYAGVRQTKEGLQMLTNSQDRARELLGQHFGLFKTVHTGPDGGPVEHLVKPADVDWLGHPIPSGSPVNPPAPAA